ncbi:hypothetical protein [Burkholderia contaminans]|uniref:hypothetical protein n=1 Tax=Burkholderia contaminans TaxID=488447 RepID=UPI0021AB2DF2|nr:hypothetical protein [Burkholderia contaminans]
MKRAAAAGTRLRQTSSPERLIRLQPVLRPSPNGDVVCIETRTRSNFPQLAASLAAAGTTPSMVSSVIVPHFEVDERRALPDFLAANPVLVAYAPPICTHGPAITHDIPRVLAGAIAHCEAAAA